MSSGLVLAVVSGVAAELIFGWMILWRNEIFRGDSFSQGGIRVVCSVIGRRWGLGWVESKPRDLESDRGYRVAMDKLELCLSRSQPHRGGRMRDSRGSIDGMAPTHAAAAPAINFALRSSRGFPCQTIFL